MKFAESWDNVGLLIEPSSPVDIKKILLTNDLTEKVMEEAIQLQTNLIISYHPPIFVGMKRLTTSQWKDRIIIKSLENKIAIYSPHTAWDACPNGVNDWLANSVKNSSKVPAMPNLNDPNFGAGRICEMSESLTLKDVIKNVKEYTGLENFQVSLASDGSYDSKISKFAVCAGSGASVLKSIKSQIDLFITGEISHHDALDSSHKQINVIALNHSNSERGYLKDFKGIIEKQLENVEINISQKDQDPLKAIEI